jgi:hypothetical protein
MERGTQDVMRKRERKEKEKRKETEESSFQRQYGSNKKDSKRNILDG